MTENAGQPDGGTTRRPSLIRTSPERPTGVVPLFAWWLVRFLEPIGYVAAAAVGLGLWILFGDYLSGLPDVATLILIAVSAVALWWAAWIVGGYPYAETWRLGNAIYAAAIGATGWIAWIASERTLEAEARFTIASGVVVICSYLVQRFRGDIVTWILLTTAAFSTAIAGGLTLAGSVPEREDSLATIGALVAAAAVHLLAGRAPKARYEATSLVVMVASLVALMNGFGLVRSAGLAVGVVGLGVAFAAYFAVSPATQVGKLSAAITAGFSILIILARTDLPLPIVLVVAGSAALAALGWAARRVIGSSSEAPVEEMPSVPPPQAAEATPQPDPSATAPAVAQPAGVATPARTNGLAIASIILAFTWIFWVGSILAVVLGHLAVSQIDASQGREGGRGMAITGLVVGYIAIGFGAIFIIGLSRW